MADQTSAYEEFLRWKNSEQGQNIINQKNTTIIKSNKPDEPAAVIAEPKEIPDAAPRGLGNGLYSERSLGQMRSKLGVPPDPDAPWMKRRGRKPKHYETASQLEEPKKKKLRGGNHIGNCLEMARLDNSEQQQHYRPQAPEPGPPKDPTVDDEVQAMKERDQVQYSHEVIIRERLLASLREQAAQDRAQGVEKIVIRDTKAKLISFEMLSIARFSITANFLLTEELVQLLRHHGGAYDFDAHEWVCGINQYQELLAQITEICQRPALAGEKPIELDPISKMSLDLLEFTVPFSDKSKKNLIGYDYQDDLSCRPRLTHLPSSLYHSLYSFQKVGVQYGADHHARIVLGDEMGVGKTI